MDDARLLGRSAYDAGVLREIAPQLWVAETSLRVLGLDMGRRMTVVRLGDGDLFVHSPAPLEARLREALDGLGAVRHVVPASNLHGHLSMDDYRKAYPQAKLFAAPGLRDKRKDLLFDGELGGEPDPDWAGDLDQAEFQGNRFVNEIVFLHRASRSLIVGDLCFNVGRRHPRMLRLWAHGLRGSPRPGPTPAFRLAVRDRRAARRSLERILDWDFDRIVVGHGDIVESGGHAVLREAFSWLPAAT